MRLQTPELVTLSKLSDKDALHLAKLVLENSDNIFNSWLEQEPQFFIDFVSNELCGKNITGLKWDDIILRIEWKWTFFNWIDKQDDNLYNPEAKDYLRKLTMDMPLVFDGVTFEESLTS